MKKKKIISGALVASIVLGATLSGCSLISTMNEADMNQTIATVNISSSENLKNDGLAGYASAIKTKNIVKRDLVAAFINVGYSYVQNGSSYSDVFTSLVTTLTSNAVVTQYATLYMLKDKAENKDSDYGYDASALANFNAKTEAVAQYEYLLGGENSDGVKLAKYNLYNTINSSLDSIEESLLSSTSSTSGSDTRSTPDNVDTTVDDYFPTTDSGDLNYGIYTGYGKYSSYSEDWDYEAVDGTTRNSRRKAYNSFITTLKTNYLISETDTDTTDVLNIAYIQEEYLSYLQQVVINDFYDLFEKEQVANISAVDSVTKEYTYLRETYNKLVATQQESYSDVSSFESAMTSVGDTSFVLYCPDTTQNTAYQEGLGYGTYGYVYNILLPFDTKQSNALSEYSNYLSNDVFTDDDYYIARRALLNDIKTTDQRSAWFNGETDYSFDTKGTSLENKYYASGDNTRSAYLFFKNNMLNTEAYKALDKYVGLYSYNGTVSKNTDGTYSLTPNKLSIDDMLSEFMGYINFVLGGDDNVSLTKNEKYGTYTTYYYEDDEDKKDEIDYSKFVYATGKVNFNANKNDLFNKSAAQYLAMSAVNELQYAYTTDTGILSYYVGYSVSAYSTSYIKEFEYAAQTAIKSGAGSYAVCAGDYGWHLIYVTDTFEAKGGETYEPSFTDERISTEGTFENQFYAWIKDSLLSNETTNKQTTILKLYSDDTTVTLYEDAYQDLLELDDSD